ncbi:hypothetical protein J437_LFUL011654 [Ladona fulva]|uniref:GDT1 family protein n=1 Tax=Ladona fulva TaxID=123851 RepID=A0A8K0KBP9_LADFU|nr:hypothetical protein J437_LFUL011654 [Ladona fulva]
MKMANNSRSVGISRGVVIQAFILAVLTISVVTAEKEPIDLETKYEGPPTLKGHILENVAESDPTSTKNNLGFIHAFIASISVIIVSELGDKTFFIAAIMAMRHPRFTVFMAVFGLAATIIPRAFTYYISTALFAIFGLKMLKEGYYMSPTGGQEEFEEVQSDLRKREDEYEKEATASLTQDVESGGSRKRQSIISFVSRIFIQSFTLTFLAEWGDRSQLTTIILAAREDVIGVTIGGILGHAICTGMAVLGGRMIAQRISVRTVTLVGGVVFLLFAVTALFFDPNAEQ